MNWFEKLKVRWGISSNWQIAIIFLVFSITGSTSLKVSKYELDFVGLTDSSRWFYWPLRILLVTISYQILLIFFGTIFGQFKFFWNMEKKMLSRFGVKFKEEQKEENDLEKNPNVVS